MKTVLFIVLLAGILLASYSRGRFSFAALMSLLFAAMWLVAS